HQVGGGGLCVSVRSDQPRIRLCLDDGCTSGSCVLNTLIELVGGLKFQIRQGIDFDCPFHSRLGGGIRHVHHIQHLRRSGGRGWYRTIKGGVCARRLGNLIGVARQEYLLQLLRRR